MIDKEPRILVISNNAFSESQNNGKTLASFFSEFDPANIFQLYFSNEIPSGTDSTEFFRITDRDVIDAFYKNSKCGNVIKKEPINPKTTTSMSKLKNFNSFRILREFLWKFGFWKSKELDNWIEKISPEVIFFCAGDSGFAYRIVKYIHSKYNTKLIVYITDDYILPRKTLNIMWWLRRWYIYKRMKNAIQHCDLFVTISEQMKERYQKVFNKNSVIAVNMCTPLLKQGIRNKSDEKIIKLVYAGGLHFKRYETLNLLSKGIENYNSLSYNHKIFLEIYSNQIPEKMILDKLNITGVSQYLGSLNSTQLIDVLNNSDILVHVESFDSKSIESTRLSISTKIPEYLSLGKPILAIGPHEVASMIYLKDVAHCITKPNQLNSELIALVENNDYKLELSKLAYDRYINKHQKEIVCKKLKMSIIDCYNNKDIDYE